jgi:hypothetical protein
VNVGELVGAIKSLMVYVTELRHWHTGAMRGCEVKLHCVGDLLPNAGAPNFARSFVTKFFCGTIQVAPRCSRRCEQRQDSGNQKHSHQNLLKSLSASL